MAAVSGSEPDQSAASSFGYRVRDVALVLLLAAVYFAAGTVGLRMAFVHPSATAVWPPSGIALAALVLLGFRVWPGVLLGAFLVNVAVAGSVATSLGIAVGNTLEGVLGAWLVQTHANGREAFDRVRDLYKFVLFAGIVSPAVSAAVGVLSLVSGGQAAGADAGRIAFTWWLGDAVSVLVLAPLMLVRGGLPSSWGRPARWKPRPCWSRFSSWDRSCSAGPFSRPPNVR